MDQAASEALRSDPAGASPRHTVAHERCYEEVRDLVFLLLVNENRLASGSVTAEKLARIIA